MFLKPEWVIEISLQNSQVFRGMASLRIHWRRPDPWTNPDGRFSHPSAWYENEETFIGEWDAAHDIYSEISRYMSRKPRVKSVDATDFSTIY